MLQISSTALIINLSVHLLKMGRIFEIITDEVRRNCWRFKNSAPFRSNWFLSCRFRRILPGKRAIFFALNTDTWLWNMNLLWVVLALDQAPHQCWVWQKYWGTTNQWKGRSKFNKKTPWGSDKVYYRIDKTTALNRTTAVNFLMDNS